MPDQPIQIWDTTQNRAFHSTEEAISFIEILHRQLLLENELPQAVVVSRASMTVMVNVGSPFSSMRVHREDMGVLYARMLPEENQKLYARYLDRFQGKLTDEIPPGAYAFLYAGEWTEQEAEDLVDVEVALCLLKRWLREDVLPLSCKGQQVFYIDPFSQQKR